MKYVLPCLLLCFFACQQTDQKGAEDQAPAKPVVINPAAEGFNAEGSDPRAIALADEVMEAMGGREAWDKTRGIRWNFFGRRTLTWAKPWDKVRIDFHDQDLIVSANIDGTKGWAFKDGQMIANVEESVGWVKKARELWINDSYWLVMPFKLKDDGVTLKYLGKDTTLDGRSAEVIELSFKGVGLTPNNKYHVFVDDSSKLVSQWAFYAKYDEEKSRFTLPWKDYQRYGDLLLSRERGEVDLTDIAVINDLGAEFFNEPIPLDTYK
jgi:hypothetical protein